MPANSKKPKTQGQKDNQIWDYIIIGGGISGLYMAYKLRQYADPETRILIIEAGCRLGGRMSMVDFHGVKVEPGAGIGRFEKDKSLVTLLKELDVPFAKFPVGPGYSPMLYTKNKLTGTTPLPNPTEKNPTPEWVKKQIRKLEKAYKKNPAPTTFHAFALKTLGKTVYRQLVMALGYTDFEKEDIALTLTNYGLDDLYGSWTGMGIDWDDLLTRLQEHTAADIYLNTTATNIKMTTPTDTGDYLFTVECMNNLEEEQNKSTSTSSHKKTVKLIKKNIIANLETTNAQGCIPLATTLKKYTPTSTTTSNKSFYGKQVIICTTAKPAQELVGNFFKNINLRPPVYLSGVQGQSFLRIYGYFTGRNSQLMGKYVQNTQVLPGPYHRIIPMGPGKRKGSVFMIVYTDNKAADNLSHLVNNTPETRQELATGLKTALGIPQTEPLVIDDIVGYYWKEGTHFYTPLNTKKFGTREEFIQNLQFPFPGLFLAGEAFSSQQGWTEGAIQSVNTVIHNLY